MFALARSVFITGAARGLGLELVKQIANSPSHPELLIAACRNPSNAPALQDIAKEKEFVKLIKLDVENDDEIDAAVEETQSLVGESGLNLLINNAGIYLNKPDGGGIRKQTRERMQRHFNVNTTSPIIVSQKFLPLLELGASHLKSEPMGCKKAAIVTISSIMGSQSNCDSKTCLDYKCSKTAVNMATIIMANELKNAGILVLALHPGWVATDMGGPSGPVTVDKSVEGLLNQMTSAGEKEIGLFISYKGVVLPY